MRLRAVRILIFFDLPTLTTEDRKRYSRFRKYLISNGYIMEQESVYSKLVLNQTSAGTAVSNLRHNKPPAGNVQVLLISERQYQGIEFLIGDRQNQIVDTTDRFVVL